MQGMRGSSRRTNARTRRWRGAWRLRRLHVLRPSLRLLRLLIVVLRLAWAKVKLVLPMMLLSLTLQSSQAPTAVRKASPLQ